MTECGFIYVNIPPILSVKAILPYCWANVWGTYRGHAQGADPSAARASQDRFVVALFATPRVTPRAKSEPPVSPIIPTLEVLLVELIESKFMFSLSVLSLSFENCCAISSYV